MIGWGSSRPEHPGLQHAGLLTGGVDLARVAVEEEGQDYVHGRLARPVDAPQKEPAAGKCEDLVAVLVDIEDPCAVECPTLGHPSRLTTRSEAVRAGSEPSSVEPERLVAG